MSDPVRLAELLYRFRSISFEHTWADAATMFAILITVPTIVPSSEANKDTDSSSGSESFEADAYFHIGVEHKGYLKLQIGQSIHASYMNNKFNSDETDYKDNEELSGLFSEISREYAILKQSPQYLPLPLHMRYVHDFTKELLCRVIQSPAGVYHSVTVCSSFFGLGVEASAICVIYYDFEPDQMLVRVPK